MTKILFINGQNKAKVFVYLNNLNSFKSNIEEIYFTRNGKYWRDSGILEEISKDIYKKNFIDTLLINLFKFGLEKNNLKEAIEEMELNYTKELDSIDFKIFRILRELGYSDMNLQDEIKRKGNANDIKDMISIPNRTVLVAKSDILVAKTHKMIQVKLPTKISLSKRNEIWKPAERFACLVLHNRGISGYCLSIMKSILDILKYIAIGFIDENAVLYIVKLDLIVMIAPIV